jgi:hypothetical protein
LVQHTSSAIALPGVRRVVHAVQATHAVAGFPSLSQLPKPQLTTGLVPPAQYSPALQGVHSGGEMPAAVCTVPAGHAPKQTWSLVALPGVRTVVHAVQSTHGVAGFPSLSQLPSPQLTTGLVPPAQYSPALQGVHSGGVVGVPAAVCTVPAGHAPKQTWSLVAVPGLRTDVHDVQSTHAVAGLPSLSQLPTPQLTTGLVPPAQYSPALQRVHAGGVVEVPATTCTVPAGHSPVARHADWLTEVE